MKMTYIRITILGYFLTGALNLRRNIYKIVCMKNWEIRGFFKTNVNSRESVYSKDKQIS